MFDYEEAQETLRVLHRATERLTGHTLKFVEEYIYVGEYNLALDDISAPFTENDIEMPHHLFVMFEDLALKLDTLKDPEYSGVAELIARQRGKTTPPLP